MYAKYIVETDLTGSQIYDQQFLANDTSNSSGSQDHHDSDFNKLGFLNVSISDPADNTVVTQNKTFLVNTSLTCLNGECGEITASTRYNQSGSADTLISENSGKPLNTDGVNTKNCGANILQGESCRVEWQVNATGSDQSYHLVDANFSSSYEEIQTNNTEDRQIQIKQVALVNISWSETGFGLLDPGDNDKPAQGNHNLSYNVSVPQKSNKVDLWLEGNDLISQQDSSYSIGIGNMSYSLTNDSSTSDNVSDSYTSFRNSVNPGVNLNTFFWLDVPTGIVEGDYLGNITFKANVSR